MGVDCEPNTIMKYRSPGGATIAAACRGVMPSAGVGGLRANVAHPLIMHPHAISSTKRKLAADIVIPSSGIALIIRIVRRRGFVHLHVKTCQTNGVPDRHNPYRFVRRRLRVRGRPAVSSGDASLSWRRKNDASPRSEEPLDTDYEQWC